MSQDNQSWALTAIACVALCIACSSATAVPFRFDRGSYTVAPGESVNVGAEVNTSADLISAGVRLRGLTGSHFELLSVSPSPEFESTGLMVDDTATDGTPPGVSGGVELGELFTEGERVVGFDLRGEDAGSVSLELIDWDPATDDTVTATGAVLDGDFASEDYYDSAAATVTPEPSTTAILALGVAGLAAVAWCRRGTVS